jgi:hypothetical protein
MLNLQEGTYMNKSLTSLLIILTITASLALTFVPQTQAATPNAKILPNYTIYSDNLGFLIVVGEIQNTGTTVLKNVGIAASLTEADGTYDTSATYAWGDYILPGQKAPFNLEIQSQGTSLSPWSGITAADITLLVSVAPEATQYQYQGVQIQSQKDSPKNNGEFWVTAEVKNTGTETAGNVVAIATFYNAQNQVIASGYSEAVTVAAGASQTIKVPAFDLNQTIVSSDKIIKSWNLLMQTASPMQSGDNYPRFSVSPENSSQGGLATPSSSGFVNNASNQGVDITLVYAAVGAVAVVVVVVSLLVVKKRKTKPSATIEKSTTTQKTGKKKKTTNR